MCHFNEILYVIRKGWNMWLYGCPHWQQEKDHILMKLYHITSFVNNKKPLLRGMSLLHDMSNDTIKFESKDLTFALIWSFPIHFHRDRDEIMPWHYVIILWVAHPFYFGAWVLYWKTTAYNVWFSRSRPSNLMFTTGFALVLVFVTFFEGSVFCYKNCFV